MKLEPYNGKLDPVPFAAYDLEWYPKSHKLRLVGLRDENGYYSFDSIEEFLDFVLTPAYRGTLFFAHAGGLADVQFVLQCIIEHNLDVQVSATFSGSSAVSVRLSKGRHRWTFCDSYWLLRDSLDRIGRALGMGGKNDGDYKCPGECLHAPEEKCVFYAPAAILRDYNRHDCEILYVALERFQREILELGGALRPTIAATALRLFRSAHLKETIYTGRVNEQARSAYVASRVEVFRSTAPAGVRFYDVNSSFPWSMTKPQPANIKSFGRAWDEADETALVKARVVVPESYAPPLPMRSGDSVYFPTGSWTAWFSGCDLQTLLEAGGRIEKSEQAIAFETFGDLGAYVDALYPLREAEHAKNCTPDQHSFNCLLYKYLCNSLYGKFGQRPEKKKILIHPPKIPDNATLLLPGVYAVETSSPVPHAHVPIAVHVTSQSRRLLWRLLRQGEPAYYCDTDGLATDREMETGTGLGALKLERTLLQGATFLRPKLYEVDGKVKAKGFPRLTSENFASLGRMESVHVTRMLRLRELYRSGATGPIEIEVEKRLRAKYRPKRCALGDGTTRAWRVGELEGE